LCNINFSETSLGNIIQFVKG